MEILIILGLLVAVGVAFQIQATKARREFLTKKYKDPVLVERLMEKTYWQGQTAEELSDSLGRPVDLETHVMKTKAKEVWKYDRQGVNRFGLKITLENGFVIGWDKK